MQSQSPARDQTLPSRSSRKVEAISLAGELGLVCLSHGPQCRFRTITLSRFRSLSASKRDAALRELYWDNLQRLHWALRFCSNRGIRLYRMISSMFPMSDTPLGVRTLIGMSASLSAVGRRLNRLDMRMIIHPDQFVVLSSDNPKVVRNSIQIMEKHALAFDLMGLPQSQWACMILHGGKAGKGDELVRIIRDLPPAVRQRLALENDEYAYGTEEILEICRRADVAMVFDNHHHAIKENLASYAHPQFRKHVLAARQTWKNPHWQVVHLSNGHAHFLDRAHSHLIQSIPRAYADVPWIEVEAKGKECAIDDLIVLIRRRIC